MNVDDTFLLKLLAELKAAATSWHSIEVLEEELLLEEAKLLFHLELLIDRGYLAYRSPRSADGRDLAARTDVGIDPGLFTRTSLLRLTAQGHEFAEDVLLQARQQAAYEAFRKPRFKTAPYVNPNAERGLVGIDDIRVVFKKDAD